MSIMAEHLWLTPVIPATQEAQIRRTEVRSQPRQTVYKTLLRKYPTEKRAGRVAQVVEPLPNKHEALNSHRTVPKKKRIQHFRERRASPQVSYTPK
jgi:hypothetical protein